MSKELTETVKELTLLGWTEEGAKVYTDLINNNNLQLFSSSEYALPLALILLFLIVVISISTIVHLNKANQRSLPSKDFKNTSDRQSQSNNRSKKQNFNNARLSNINKGHEQTEPLTSLPIVNKGSIKKLVHAIGPLTDNGKKLVQAIGPLTDYVKKLVKAIVPLKESAKITSKTSKTVSLSNISNHFSKLLEDTSIDLDKTAEIFILSCIIIYDLSIKVLQLSINFFKRNAHESVKQTRKIISNKNFVQHGETEFKEDTSGEQLLNSLNKDQLIKLITSNPSTLKKLNFKEMQEELMKKTNVELKAMLKGEVNISRLKKKELVRKILSIEKNKLMGLIPK